MKKKKLNPLHLKKTTISHFSKNLKGGQPIVLRPTFFGCTSNGCTFDCTLDCPSRFCPTETQNCPVVTIAVGCQETLLCPTISPVGCGPTNTLLC